MSGGAQVVDLDRGECLRLLETKQVGRIGFVGEDGPVILPMNYLLSGDQLILRTTAYGSTGRSVLDAPVSFEIDDVDEFLEAGWSVLVSGTARLLNAAEVEQLRFGAAPTPWAEGPRTLFLGIRCDRISGRRLLPR
jgi:uncharacterized protein